MPDSIKKHRFSITVWTAVWLAVALIWTAFSTWISLSSAEHVLNTKIQANSSKIELIEQNAENKDKTLQTHINYSYTIKSDLKAEIKSNDDKLEKILTILISHVAWTQ